MPPRGLREGIQIGQRPAGFRVVGQHPLQCLRDFQQPVISETAADDLQTEGCSLRIQPGGKGDRRMTNEGDAVGNAVPLRIMARRAAIQDFGMGNPMRKRQDIDRRRDEHVVSVENGLELLVGPRLLGQCRRKIGRTAIQSVLDVPSKVGVESFAVVIVAFLGAGKEVKAPHPPVGHLGILHADVAVLARGEDVRERLELPPEGFPDDLVDRRKAQILGDRDAQAGNVDTPQREESAWIDRSGQHVSIVVSGNRREQQRIVGNRSPHRPLNAIRREANDAPIRRNETGSRPQA